VNTKIKVTFLSLFITLIILITLPTFIYCRNHGFKYIKNYSAEEYKLHPQNWSVLQDKRGLIYIGNNGGLLEFDGVSWRNIPVPNFSVRSLAVDEKGVIYVGGNNEIGFLAPDEKGTLVYQSLCQHIPAEKRDFSNAWKTHCLNDSVYFRTSRFLFHWNSTSGKMNILEPQSQFNASFYCDGKYFVHQRDLGLMEIVGNSLQLVPNGTAMKAIKIYMMVEFQPGTYLLGTRENGFYLYNYGGGTLTPFLTEADDFIMKNQLYDGIRLSHSPGTFALGTVLGGLVIIDSRGRIIDMFNKSNGLLDDNIRFVLEDNGGNLWLGLNDGISRIEYAPSPVSFYDNRSGLSGIMLAVVRGSENKDLYVGTTNGLFVMESNPSNSRQQNFIQVAGVMGSCFSLLSGGDFILATTTDGLFQLDTRDRRVSRLTQLSTYVLLRSRADANRLWVGNRSGLQSFYSNSTAGSSSRWQLEHSFETINQQVRSIVEEKQSLWLSMPGKGVIRMFFPDHGSIDNPVITVYDESHGLPTQEVSVFTAAARVRFGTEKGLYYFDEKSNAFRSDTLLGSSFADGSSNVFRLAEDSRGHLWFHSNNMNYHAVPRPDGSFIIDSRSFARIPQNQVNAIYPDGEIIWFAANNSLIRYDTRIETAAPRDFPVYIRHLGAQDQLVFNGYDESKFFPVLPFEERNIRFTFAALFFQEEARTGYSYFLEGYDKGWSNWSSETQKDYTNLDGGTYRFRVKAKNVYGDLGREALFQFRVLPPWYRTWWAYLCGALLAFLLVFFTVRWRSAQLVREKGRLEEIVKNRTRQLEMQARQLEGQAMKLQEMDKVKSRFFANISHEFRTPLTLIMGPLEQITTGSGDTKPRRLEDYSGMMLRNARRLLTLINQLLDLAKFDGGKMKLRASRQNIIPFLENILASFQLMAAQKKVSLSFHAGEEEIWLYFDAEQMEKVFYNLLANAMNHTPSKGTVTVAVGQRPGDAPGMLEITVRDTGTGIPADQMPHIFDYLFQATRPESAENKIPAGTGIGLALTREIIQLHGGSIDVASREGKDSGTVFTIQLPMGNAHLKPGEIVEVPSGPVAFKPAELVETLETIPMNESEAAVEAADVDDLTDGDEPAERDRKVVLVVEDNADVRLYIRGSLEPGYRVIEAPDGRQGIAAARKHYPDIIISDIMMPGVDGYELCRVLKKDVATSHIPIILLTARVQEENVIQGLECGADDYVTKPFNTQILMARVKNLMDLRRQLQEKYKREIRLQPAEIPVSSVEQEFMKDLQKAMEANLSDPEFNIDRLADLLYMSRATLNRKIRALTGESANRYIQVYRLKRGAQLLKDNFGNVTQVAFAVGFSSTPYFAKCFKEIFHQTPQSYQAAESTASLASGGSEPFYKKVPTPPKIFDKGEK
jgi:signal transduction histidine kinase/DNA-binding response OmpR family regulator